MLFSPQKKKKKKIGGQTVSKNLPTLTMYNALCRGFFFFFFSQVPHPLCVPHKPILLFHQIICLFIIVSETKIPQYVLSYEGSRWFHTFTWYLQHFTLVAKESIKGVVQ